MTMITPSYLGETIEYSSLHACRSTLEDPTSSRENTHSLRSPFVIAIMRPTNHPNVPSGFANCLRKSILGLDDECTGLVR